MTEENKDTLTRLRKVIHELLQTSRAKGLDQNLEIELQTNVHQDLEIDSLEVMDLLAAIEDEFDVLIDVEKMRSVERIGELVAHIDEVSNK